MTVTRETLRDLALLCGNECTFPGCVAPIYDTVHNDYVGHVAHIKAQSPGGPRHDKSQTKEQRDGLDNLMMLCGSHHRIIAPSIKSNGSLSNHQEFQLVMDSERHQNPVDTANHT